MPSANRTLPMESTFSVNRAAISSSVSGVPRSGVGCGASGGDQSSRPPLD